MDKRKIASLIDHALLSPILSDEELIQGCATAEKYQVASVCVKPCHVKEAKKILNNSSVLVGTVIGFPHGSHSLDIKIKEAEETIAHGADELDILVNIGKIFSQDWDYLNNEIKQLTDIIHQKNKLIKVIFETGYLNNGQIIELIKICETNKADYIKTSTGFAFLKNNQNQFLQSGAEKDTVELMLKESIHCKVKASGGIKDWETADLFYQMGVSRLGTSATVKILE